MNLKFWQWGRRPTPVAPMQLVDPGWAQKRELFLQRLANTPPEDPLLSGILALLDQEVLMQVQKCQSPTLTDSEARSICASLGLLTGLRSDLAIKWKEQLARKAASDAAAAAERARAAG